MERPTLPDLLPTTHGRAPTAVAPTAAARYAAEPEVRAALELMPQLVWTTTPDGYHDYYNEQWYRYTGMPRPGDAAADAEGWNWKNYLHPDDYDRALAVWSRCLATGEPYEIEYRFKEAATGRYRWFLGRALPRRDADVNGAPGRIVRWFGTCTDIDDQKRAAEQLREQAVELELTSQQLQEQQAELEVQAETLAEANANLEAALADAVRARRDADAARRQAGAAETQLRSVFAQAPAAVSVTLGPEHRFVLVNPRAEEAVGRQDLVGQTYAGAFPEFAAQGFAAVLDRVYATGEPFVADDMRVEVPRPDGATEPRWYDFVYQPLRDAAGAVTGVLQHAVDVTPRVAARAALAAASAQLVERTAAAEQARRGAAGAPRRRPTPPRRSSWPT
jgi:PAS domain S-box-containing protein